MSTIRHIGQFSANEIASEAFKDSLVRAVDMLARALQQQVGGSQPVMLTRVSLPLTLGSRFPSLSYSPVTHSATQS